MSYHALNYVDLIIAFAFERQVFITLFICIGAASVAMAFCFWFVVRMTTRLAEPPRFRFWSFLALTAPPPAIGMTLALCPIFFVIFSFWLLLNGYKIMPFNYENYMDNWLLDSWTEHYMVEKLDASQIQGTRAGRTGLCFLSMGLYLMYLSSFVFVPRKISITEKIHEQKNDANAMAKSIWKPTMWKRNNLIFTSLLLSFFLVVVVEFSYWEGFGDNIWYIIVAFEFVAVWIEGVMGDQLQETLLLAPLACCFGLTTGIVTFGANDFKDFLLGYILDFGLILVQRVYFDTGLDAIFGFIGSIFTFVMDFVKSIGHFFYKRTKRGKAAAIAALAAAALAAEEVVEEEEGEGEDSVEPIIDNYVGYSMDTLAMMYQPFLIILMMWFRNEMMLPVLYGIREQDMEYYLWFSIIISVFQLIADIFIHNVNELFQGWKIYDYLIYTRYRFIQREKRWKGLEVAEDECIDESMRSVDQMCFSSQYYMMCTFHVTSVMMVVIAIEIMIRYGYNMFGDPAMLILIPFVMISCNVVRNVSLWGASKIEFWKVKHQGTAWHALPDEEDTFGVPRWEELEKIKGASHEAFLMNQRITSETFRFQFLNYNRPWILAQLPSILTPRTLRRGRPYLLAQFTKILGSLNPDVSSDSEDDARPRFGPISLTAPSRNIIRLWLAQARRRQRLQSAVQGIISENRKAECETCLSRRQLQVELVIPLDVMGDKFERHSNADAFDVKGWKEFFKKHQKYKTLCLTCSSREKSLEPLSVFNRAPNNEDSDHNQNAVNSPLFDPVYLNASSNAIARKWYRRAQDRVFGKSGKKRAPVSVSDDEEDGKNNEWGPMQLSAASMAMARKWITLSRSRIKIKTAGKPKKKDEPVKPVRKKPPGKGKSKKAGRKRK